MIEDSLQKYDETEKIAAYKNDLRMHIRESMEKEASHYLEFMDSAIQHGWSFLKCKCK